MTDVGTVLYYRTFSLPKDGNSPEECEDAFAGDGVNGCFALADGATESIFAGEWATMLCNAFVADPAVADDIPGWQAAVQSKWLDFIRTVVQPWYVEEKLRDGAFATFLGLIIKRGTNGEPSGWRAWAVGDSCVFHVHDDSLQLAFPLDQSAAFSTRPGLISSRQPGPIQAASVSGTLGFGDSLLLMTDALAEWFLAKHEAGDKPWQELLRLKKRAFPDWAESLRSRGEIKNDDMTLLAIEARAPKK